jgi:hypothetical protein
MAGPRVRVRRGRRAKLPTLNQNYFGVSSKVSYQSAVASAHRGKQSGRPDKGCQLYIGARRFKAGEASRRVCVLTGILLWSFRRTRSVV